MNIFTYEVVDDGLVLRLNEKKRKLFTTSEQPLKIKDWSSFGNKDIFRGLAAIGTSIQEVENLDTDEILISHEQIAALSEADAQALNLPVSVPYQLRVWGTGSWYDNSYDLNSEFLDKGQSVYIDRRIGSILEIGRKRYRIPDPLYSIISEVASFNPNDSKDSKIEGQAKISEILGNNKVGRASLDSDDQIANIKIRHVSGFSASVSGTLEDPQLRPVLFSRKLLDVSQNDDELLDEAQQILNEQQAESFNSEFFKTGPTVSTYVLSSGEYVYIDPSVRSTLSAFKEISISDSGTRNAFLKSPNAALAARIPDGIDDAETQVQQVFVETAQFSDRVIGINKWEAPVLPWLAKESNEWGTNTLIFEQPGNSAPVVIPKEALADAIAAVKSGLAEGKTNTTLDGNQIPVSRELLESMTEFLPAEADPPENRPDKPEPEKKEGPFVVETIDGFEALNFVRNPSPPSNKLVFQTPRALVPSTKLMSHQENGIKWLISAFNMGQPGVLNADDMGLGKTLQALVFLALYQEQIPATGRKPCLIVAPSGLLDNWQKEIKTHLDENGLGSITKAYGSGLKNLKIGGAGKDTDAGVPKLNQLSLESSSIILTTYESLRDYQISFSQVSFGVVVFDEIQKAKNPRSLISRAAAAINGKFQIGLSGTPVENSLADLWTILDILAPGLMRYSLQEFMKFYSGSLEDPETFQRLTILQSELLMQSDSEYSPPVLRRLKSEVFQDGGLPQKLIHPAETTCRTMPEEQGAVYKAEVEKVQRNEIKMVQGLQSFKRISMSPRRYTSWLDDQESFIASSARLTEFFQILDNVKAKDEKVLVFLESRELQPILAQVLKERYHLAKLPLIINGAISGQIRQSYVDEFQSEEQGFNVIIISPKAGGVGLTLTAANNVVHLERWWNPAVEDQCNDRAYRIGQNKDVNVFTPVSKHPISEIPSFDLVLDQILTQKRQLAQSLFVPSELSPDDFKNIFSGGSIDEANHSFRKISLEESYLIETGEDFEDYVGSSLHHVGFSVLRTKRSWDYGCDLIASNNKHTVLVQCKQVMSDKKLSEGVDEIIQSFDRYQSKKPTALALITNAKSLSKTQTALASKHDVMLILGGSIDRIGDALLSLLD